MRAIEIFDEDPALFEPVKNLVRLGHPEQNKIGFTGVRFDTGNALQFSREPCAFAAYRRRLRIQHIRMLQNFARDELRQDVYRIMSTS